MHRFFVNPNQVDGSNNTIQIVGEDVKHISKVLRLKEGEEVVICDGQSMEYRVIIKEIDKEEVIVNIEESFQSQREANIEITLYQGLPKSTKMDFIIQKCTELGIHKIVPVSTSRSIVKIEGSKSEDKKIERWQRIAYEAAKQSKRGRIPQIGKIKKIQDIWKELGENDLNVVAYENQRNQGLRKLIQKFSSPITKIGILIGPEGGFEQEEIRQAQENGVFSISLGPRILRTETAGFAALTILMYELGDIGGH